MIINKIMSTKWISIMSTIQIVRRKMMFSFKPANNTKLPPIVTMVWFPLLQGSFSRRPVTKDCTATIIDYFQPAAKLFPSKIQKCLSQRAKTRLSKKMSMKIAENYRAIRRVCGRLSLYLIIRESIGHWKKLGKETQTTQ